MTNLGYVASKSVSGVKSYTQALNFIGRADRISKKLGGNFLHEGLCDMFITNDDEFRLLWVKFQFHTIYPLLKMSKTLSELSKTGIKVPLVKC